MLRSRVDRLISFEQKNLNLTGVDGRSVVRHVDQFPNYLNVNRLTELVRNENLFETDEFKSGVKPSIRRTGAELFDFLVFNRKYFDRND